MNAATGPPAETPRAPAEHGGGRGERRVRPMTEHRRADAINATVVLGIGLLLIAIGSTGMPGLPRVFDPPSPWWHVVPLVLACGAITASSSRPMAVFAATSALLVADTLVGVHLAVALAWSNGVYAVYRHAGRAGRRRVTIGLPVAFLVFGLVELLAGAETGIVIAVTLQLGAFAAIAAWWGGDVRAGHELAALEAERAADIARIASLERAEAVRAERAGMARDLHDLVSSHLSAIAIHSSAALQLDPDDARDRRVLGEVRAESVAALDEMRRLIHLLRADDDAARGLALDDAASLEAVVERFRVAGLEIDARIEAGDVEPEAGRVLALIAREALTNALKHGDGAVRLRCTVEAGAARLVVENPVGRAEPVSASDPEAPDAPAARGAGIGLEAMRERAAALGGTVEVRRGDDGATWTVDARVPNRAAREEPA